MCFHYEEFGDKNGAVLVLLHGGGVGGWMWDKQIAHFSKYHCLVPTLPGHGLRSDETAFSINKSAIELIELIERVSCGKDVFIMGFSIGAQITVEILSLAPNLIHSAVINSALVLPMKMMKSLIGPSIKMTFPLIKYKAFAKAQAKQLYMNNEYFERYYQDSLKIKPATLIDVLKENMSYSLPDNFSNSTANILVTVGEKEKGIMKKSALLICSRNKNCELLIAPTIGHGFPVAQPQKYNQIVEEWFNKKPLHIGD